jgi:hypothetical protein
LLVFSAWYQPLSTTNNTVTKGTKLPENRTVIRKLSFAPFEPRRLIFDYCGAIFALPEAFFFGYSGAIFERLKVSFHCLQRRKICTICAENRRCTKSTFLSG